MAKLHHPIADPDLSPLALALYRFIRHQGGALRIGALLKRAKSDDDLRAFCDSIGELTERYWITVILRKSARNVPGEPGLLEDIDRLCTTRYARRKHRGLWRMG